MKNISASLLTHLSSDATTMAICCKITRTDAAVYGFTEHDADLVISGVTYKSLLGITATNVETTTGLNVDTLDCSGMLNALGISESDIVSGRWDYAVFRVFSVNWADLTMGDYKMRRGVLGQISITGSFVVEMRGVAQYLQQVVGELASPSCKADLFDARCKVNPAAWTFSGTVGTVTSAQRAWTDAALTQASQFFTAGKVTWLTGGNAGLKMEVKNFEATAVLLQEAMPYAVVAGDTYSIKAGCMKRYIEDCGTKFSNQNNFRGMPYVPGNDKMLAGN